MNYEAIKALAKQQHRPVTSLIALAPQNDPFYVGTERDIRLGRWFAGLWQRLGYTSGVHIRRMHYAIVSQNPPVPMTNGLPYENTELCWNELVQASKCARYLELVDPGAFVDRRNGEPIDHIVYDTERTAMAWVSGDAEGDAASILPDFPERPFYSLGVFASPQPYHTEIWCEKSTMNDILGDLAARYQAVLQYGLGELSITVALDAIKRFERSGKPVRIFYMSDFDPAGAGMPVSMARKLEYFIDKLSLSIDVRLYPVVLTHEQVQHYTRLLPTPIKDSERRKAKFEERYGGGAVELDALEALYPNELAGILSREIERYFDTTLDRRVNEARNRTRQQLAEAQEQVYKRYGGDLDVLRAEYREIERLFAERIASHVQRRSELWQAISSDLEAMMPDVSSEDVPEARPGRERDDVLFDSIRDYLTQNEMYQAYKGNGTDGDEGVA